MATLPEVELAVQEVVARLAAMDPDVRRRYLVHRTISCRVSDLRVVWSGRLTGDGLQDLSTADGSRAQVRLTVSSDDLISLAEGRMAVPTAWATGRLRVQAAPLDLLKLRALL